MNSAIVTVGDELISGEKQDANFPWLARRLAELGIACVLHETVGDNQVAIARAVISTRAVAKVVIVTGGLGPTSDDVTREGIARALGRELTFNESVADRISARFPEAEQAFLDRILKQAYAVEQADLIVPEKGTAPGLILFDGDQIMYVLPGVPAELEEMFDAKVAPHLAEQLGELEPLRRRILRTVGLRETEVEKAIGDLETVYGDVRFGYLPHLGMVDVSLTAKASDESDVEAAAGEIRERLGDAVFGEGEEPLQAALGALLVERGATIATAESCTGGLLGKMLTDVSGSSAYYLGGVISYSNAAKMTLLGIEADLIEEHGAVSEVAAERMASSVRQLLEADIGVSITGVAGPTGGTERAPVGTVYIAVTDASGTHNVELGQPGSREQIRRWAATKALDEVRRLLLSRQV